MHPLAADDPSAIGPHRLLARLGAVGMGKVYLARTPDGRLCALKVVKEELAHDHRFRARFAREVRSAQRVRGPFTPAVVDAGPEAATPWMATEEEEYTYHPYAWDLETGENLLEGIEDLTPYRHLALHPAGEVIAAILADDEAPPTLLDPNTHERIDTLY